MTYEEVKEMLEQTGLPVAYHHFEEEEAVPAPYIVYHYPANSDVSADNMVYKKIENLYIELYTNKKDLDSEWILHNILTNAGFCYERSEAWIESEKMLMNRYEMEVLIDDEKQQD